MCMPYSGETFKGESFHNFTVGLVFHESFLCEMLTSHQSTKISHYMGTISLSLYFCTHRYHVRKFAGEVHKRAGYYIMEARIL